MSVGPCLAAFVARKLTPRQPPGRGLHSFTLKLNLSTFGTLSWVKLGYVGHKDSSS